MLRHPQSRMKILIHAKLPQQCKTTICVRFSDTKRCQRLAMNFRIYGVHSIRCQRLTMNSRIYGVRMGSWSSGCRTLLPHTSVFEFVAALEVAVITFQAMLVAAARRLCA